MKGGRVRWRGCRRRTLPFVRRREGRSQRCRRHPGGRRFRPSTKSHSIVFAVVVVSFFASRRRFPLLRTRRRRHSRRPRCHRRHSRRPHLPRPPRRRTRRSKRKRATHPRPRRPDDSVRRRGSESERLPSSTASNRRSTIQMNRRVGSGESRAAKRVRPRRKLRPMAMS